MSIIERVIEKAGKNEKLPTKSLNKDLKEDEQNALSKDDPARQAALQDGQIDRNSTNRPRVEAKNKTSNVYSINRKRLADQGFLGIEKVTSQLSEEYRMIKRPLLNNAFKTQENDIKHANLILITSSQPGEGKTFTAINLALSIASERDKKVLLIDADVAKPSISKVLNISSDKKGLTDYLDGNVVDFSEIMIKTDVGGLTIVPAGSKHGFSTELLTSKKMVSLADELHSRYSDRIVIFDSPPLLATTQAEVLAELVGQVVLVVESEGTLQRTVADSVDKLKGCDVVMVLLNKLTHSIGMTNYGYGQYGH